VDRGIEKAMLVAFTDVIRMYGVDAHARWAMPLLANLCKKHSPTTDGPDLLAVIASGCEGDVMRDAITAAAEMYEAIPDQGRRVILGRLDILIGAR
jgi:hypothetical protein